MRNELVVVQKELGRGGALCKEYNRVRLNPDLNWRVEMFYALEMIEKNEQLARCEPSTIGRSIIDAGTMGLSLSPAKKEAYLVPYNIKVGPNQWMQQCTLSVSYMGMEQIAYRTGLVKLIQTNLVRKGDKFEVWTDDVGRHVKHAENLMEQGSVTHAYCIIKLSSGEQYVEVMNRRELEACKEAAAKKNKGKVPFTWTGEFRGEMYRKSVLRRAWKHVPRTGRHEAALEAVERTDPMDFVADSKIDAQSVVEESVVIDGDMIDELVEIMEEGGVPPKLHGAWLKGLAAGLGYQSIKKVLKSDFERARDGMKEGLKRWQASMQQTTSDSKQDGDTSREEAA